MEIVFTRMPESFGQHVCSVYTGEKAIAITLHSIKEVTIEAEQAMKVETNVLLVIKDIYKTITTLRELQEKGIMCAIALNDTYADKDMIDNYKIFVYLINLSDKPITIKKDTVLGNILVDKDQDSEFVSVYYNTCIDD